MPEMTLVAETNRVSGSRPSGRLRAENKIPAVVYGGGEAPISVSVVRRDLRLALSGGHGSHALINLDVGGSHHLVMVKEMQRNPVRNEVIHVDFLRVSRDDVVSADVTITLVGDAHEVRLAGGKVEQQLFKLVLSGKPDDIPAEVVVDVSEMAPGHILRVSEMTLPSGVTATTPEDEIVAVGNIIKRAATPGEEGYVAEGDEEGGVSGEAGGEASAGEAASE